MSDPVRPPQRIGDAERDHAADQLREHLVQGRLDQAEFDDRLDAAMRARYAADLDGLFGDLPPSDRTPAIPAVNRPATQQPVHPGQQIGRNQQPFRGISHRTEVMIDSVSWVIWPVAIGLITLLGWGDFWWLVFVPIGLTTAWQAWKHSDDDNDDGADNQQGDERR